MKCVPNLSWKPWALGLVAYALVATREVPIAYAQSVVDTDCSTDLDQPDTTYRLTGNVAGDCIIAAENIILDGQNLYSIAGEVRNDIYMSGQKTLTLQNLPYVGRTYPQGFSSADVISIENSTIGTFGGNYMYAAVHITDSVVEDFSYYFSGGSITRSDITGSIRSNGDLTITDSSITGGSGVRAANGNLTIVGSYIDEQAVEILYSGSISVTDSSIGDVVRGPNDIEITDSTVASYVHASNDVSITDSTVASYVHASNDVSITDSTVDSYVHAGHDVSITRSTIGEEVFADGSISVTGSTLQGKVDADATVTITDSEVAGQVVGDGVTVADSKFGNKIWSLSGDISVTDSIIYGANSVPAFAPQPTLFASIPHGAEYGVGYDNQVAISASLGNITVVNSLIGGRIWMDSHTPDGMVTIERSAVYGVVLAQQNAVTVTDSAITVGSFYANNSIRSDSLILTDTPPSLTVTPLDMTLDYGKSFNPFSGVEADDVKDGDLAAAVSVAGEVGNEAGIYRLDYSVTDSGTTVTWNGTATSSGPSTATSTRVIIRGEKPIQSTNVGIYKANKEKQAAEAALPAGVSATIETLKMALTGPVTTNDPEALKKLIDLVRQLIVALLELLTAQGKVK